MKCKKKVIDYMKMNSYCLLCIWNDLEEQSHVLLKEMLKLMQKFYEYIFNVITHVSMYNLDKFFLEFMRRLKY